MLICPPEDRIFANTCSLRPSFPATLVITFSNRGITIAGQTAIKVCARWKNNTRVAAYLKTLNSSTAATCIKRTIFGKSNSQLIIRAQPVCVACTPVYLALFANRLQPLITWPFTPSSRRRHYDRDRILLVLASPPS